MKIKEGLVLVVYKRVKVRSSLEDLVTLHELVRLLSGKIILKGYHRLFCGRARHVTLTTTVSIFDFSRLFSNSVLVPRGPRRLTGVSTGTTSTYQCYCTVCSIVSPQLPQLQSHMRFSELYRIIVSNLADIIRTGRNITRTRCSNHHFSSNLLITL